MMKRMRISVEESNSSRGPMEMSRKNVIVVERAEGIEKRGARKER